MISDWFSFQIKLLLYNFNFFFFFEVGEWEIENQRGKKNVFFIPSDSPGWVRGAALPAPGPCEQSDAPSASSSPQQLLNIS